MFNFSGSNVLCALWNPHQMKPSNSTCKKAAFRTRWKSVSSLDEDGGQKQDGRVYPIWIKMLLWQCSIP